MRVEWSNGCTCFEDYKGSVPLEWQWKFTVSRESYNLWQRLFGWSGGAPFISGSKSAVKFLKSVSCVPRLTSFLLSRIASRACVAQAFVMTCRAKKTLPLYSVSGASCLLSSSRCHLNRKIKPYSGLQTIAIGTGVVESHN